jgi:NitT/TauT family transport system ATP-binding protein
MEIPFVHLQDVCFRYSNTKVDILKNVSFNVNKGEFVAVLGSSGCGKSTLLQIIAGLFSGYLGDVKIKGLKPAEYLKSHGEMGYMFQDAALMPWFNVRENVELPSKIKKIKINSEEFLKLVGLKGIANKTPISLSGGMKQRVSIARAISINPEIILLDEPFNSLDEMNKNNIHDEIYKIFKDEKRKLQCVIMVTHSIEEAVLLSDRIIIFSSKMPTEILKICHIDFGSNRNLHEIRNSKKFFSKVVEIRNLIDNSNEKN